MASGTSVATAGSRCPRCEAVFTCAVATGACWCAQVTLTAQRREDLAERYEGCLCRACLRDVEQAASR